MTGGIVPVGAGALFSTGVGLSPQKRERFFRRGWDCPRKSGSVFSTGVGLSPQEREHFFRRGWDNKNIENLNVKIRENPNI